MAMIKIDISRCKGCELCVQACPKSTIATTETLNDMGVYPAIVVDMDQCTGCAMCAIICPDVAIEVWR